MMCLSSGSKSGPAAEELSTITALLLLLLPVLLMVVLFLLLPQPQLPLLLLNVTC
jgi:hypothetical protein